MYTCIYIYSYIYIYVCTYIYMRRFENCFRALCFCFSRLPRFVDVHTQMHACVDE